MIPAASSANSLRPRAQSDGPIQQPTRGVPARVAVALTARGDGHEVHPFPEGGALVSPAGDGAAGRG